MGHSFLPSFSFSLSDPSQYGPVGVGGAAGKGEPGQGRWGWAAPSGTSVEGEGRTGSDGHEVDFCAGVAFWEGCGRSGFEFTQPKPVVMISLCSLFLKKKRVCVTRKPQMFMVNFLSTEDDASKKHIKKYHTM